jgi:hypothetical protein
VKRRTAYVLTLSLLALGGFLIGRARADQPHMQAALEHLRAARGQLDVAEADKGGHRVRAIRLVNDAIGEVERGIAYDRRH